MSRNDKHGEDLLKDPLFRDIIAMIHETVMAAGEGGYRRGDMVLHIPMKTSSQRLGQKICNYIHSKGYRNEDVHQMLFHMWDEEFFQALVMDDKVLAKRFNKAARKSGKIAF